MKEAWGKKTVGKHMLKVVNKLKNIKKSLKDFNKKKKEFWSILERVKTTRMTLERTQKSLASVLNDLRLSEEERISMGNLRRYSWVNEPFIK